MIIVPLSCWILLLYFRSQSLGLSFTPAPYSIMTAADRRNQQFTRQLMGTNIRPLKNALHDFKPLAMEWQMALAFLDHTIEKGFIPDLKAWLAWK